MALLLSPAHNADLMVGHGKGHLLLKDPTRVGVKLGCDINSTGDGTSGMDLRPQLVCLCDLQSQCTPHDMSVTRHQQQQSDAVMRCALTRIEIIQLQTKVLGESLYMKAVLLTQANITMHRGAKL